MIHQYKNNGYNIVLDVNSGSIHVVDDVVYDVLSLMDEENADRYGEAEFSRIADVILKNDYKEEVTKEDLKDVFSDLQELEENGTLFTKDVYKEGVIDFKKRQTVVKALCLHIAHDCNLACRYCFAGEGEYQGDRSLMSYEVGKKALDFLVANSGSRRNLEVDFFGGEPLMNWQVVKDLVAYGREQEKLHDKHFRFTVTTNGVLLNDDIQEFINKEMDNVVISLDGRKEVNDRMRVRVDGSGSYDRIIPNFKKLVEKRPKNKDWYVRGTYTKYNLDFSNDVMHLYDLGFDQISVEPVMADPSEPYAITEADLPRIFKEYEILSEKIQKIRDEGKFINFFHFMIDLDQGPCAIKRLRGCGSGNEYVSVTPDGDIYPCHQFVGITEFKMGNLYDGTFNEEMKDMFAHAHVYNKPECKKCWAKFYCSGGCNANNYIYAGDIHNAHKLSCQIQKKRLECAIMMKAVKMLDSAE